MTQIIVMGEPEPRKKKRRRSARQRKAAKQVAAAARTGLAPRLIQVYREAGLGRGLGRRGLWLLSQRNMARALAKIEPEPDINKLHFFAPR